VADFKAIISSVARRVCLPRGSVIARMRGSLVSLQLTPQA